MIRTLVVDDDFRVAEVHAEYVAKVDGFQVVGIARTLAEAREAIKEHHPDLLLLDLYLPDGSGLELLREIRGAGEPVLHVIVVTAARDVENVRAALAGGATHYVVKPFRLSDLRPRLESVRDLYGQLARLSDPNQADIDRVYGALRRSSAAGTSLPKGISRPTLRLVVDALRGRPEGATASELEADLDISRATAQRYLTFLAEVGRAELTPRYRDQGRPLHVYRSR